MRLDRKTIALVLFYKGICIYIFNSRMKREFNAGTHALHAEGQDLTPNNHMVS